MILHDRTRLTVRILLVFFQATVSEYTGALSISLGLACLTQSGAFLAVFFIYLVMIIPLISLEENGLRNAFGERYGAYRQKVKKLVPFVY